MSWRTITNGALPIMNFCNDEKECVMNVHIVVDCGAGEIKSETGD